METNNDKAQAIANEVKKMVMELQRMGRTDLLLSAISVPVLEELRIEAAKTSLSRLRITSDYHFILTDYGKEVIMTPVHKALYLFFLNHPEGVQFKDLVDHSEEITRLYKATTNGSLDIEKINETVSRLVNPTDNAINEKCSRIKAAFAEHMDEYALKYYMISSHVTRYFNNSARVWFKRLKVITLPRHLVIKEYE